MSGIGGAGGQGFPIDWRTGVNPLYQPATPASTRIDAGEFTPPSSTTVAGGLLGLPASPFAGFDLETQLQGLSDKFKQLQLDLAGVRAAPNIRQTLGVGIAGAAAAHQRTADEFRAAGVGAELRREAAEAGVNWSDGWNLRHQLQGAGLDRQTAQLAADATMAALNGDPRAEAKLAALKDRLGALGLPAFEKAMSRLGERLGNDTSALVRFGGSSDASSNVALKGLMATLTQAGTAAHGARGGSVVAEAMLDPVAERYAAAPEQARGGPPWRAGAVPYWERNLQASTPAARAEKAADIKAELGADLAALVRVGDPDWKASAEASPLLRMQDVLGGLRQARTDRADAAQALRETSLEASKVRIDGGDVRELTRVLQGAGLDGAVADKLARAVQAQLTNDPQASKLLDEVATALQAGPGGVEEFQEKLQALGQGIGQRGVMRDDMLAMLRGTANSLAAAATKAFGVEGGAAVQEALAGPLATAYAKDELRDKGHHFGLYGMGLHQRERKELEASLRKEFSSQLGAISRLTANPDAASPLPPALMPAMGYLEALQGRGQDNRAVETAERGLRARTAELKPTAADFERVDQALRQAGLDSRTADLLGKAVEARLKGDPNASDLLAQVGDRLQANVGTARFGDIVERLGQRMGAFGQGGKGALLAEAAVRGLAAAGTQAFGAPFGETVATELGRPLADRLMEERRAQLGEHNGWPMFAHLAEPLMGRMQEDLRRGTVDGLGSLVRVESGEVPPFEPLKALFPGVAGLYEAREDRAQVDGARTAVRAAFRAEGAPSWQSQQIGNALRSAGLDADTAGLVSDALRSMLEGRPDAAQRMEALVSRLPAGGGLERFTAALDRLPDRLPDSGGSGSSVLRGLAMVLSEAATRAFGPAGGTAVEQQLVAPFAERMGRAAEAGMRQRGEAPAFDWANPQLLRSELTAGFAGDLAGDLAAVRRDTARQVAGDPTAVIDGNPMGKKDYEFLQAFVMTQLQLAMAADQLQGVLRQMTEGGDAIATLIARGTATRPSQPTDLEFLLNSPFRPVQA